MKVLISFHLPPPIHGSALVGQQIFNSSLLNSSFEITYINLLASRKVQDSGRFQGRKLISFIRLLWVLTYNLIQNRPKICYYALTTKGLAFYRDVFLVGMIKLFRVPIVYHLHNKGVQTNSNNWIKYRLYRFVFHRSEIILLSELLYSDVEQFVNKEHVHICPNGIKNTSDIHLKKEIPVILFLSNLVKSKGVYDLIEACYLLNQRGVKFYLNIIGNEGDILKNDLKELINRYKIDKCVKILGPLYDNEKFKALKSSNLFVFPTFNDCFPLVLLEAMQASLPVISTYEGGIPDIVIDGETGYLVPQRDIHALADRMQELIENPQLREQMGQAGRKRYEELFTAEIFENRLLEILQQVSLKYT